MPGDGRGRTTGATEVEPVPVGEAGARAEVKPPRLVAVGDRTIGDEPGVKPLEVAEVGTAIVPRDVVGVETAVAPRGVVGTGTEVEPRGVAGAGAAIGIVVRPPEVAEDGAAAAPVVAAKMTVERRGVAGTWRLFAEAVGVGPRGVAGSVPPVARVVETGSKKEETCQMHQR